MKYFRDMESPKISVGIILGNNQQINKKCPIDGNTIIVKKGKKGFQGKEWAPKFNGGCLVLYFSGIWPFKQLKQKLYVKDGADECIDFSKNPIDVPGWNKPTAERFFEAKVIKHAGHLEVVAKVPIVFYIGLLISIFTLIMVFLSSRGMRF